MRLSTSDRQTIDAFTSGRSRQGSKLSSDGRRLDGHWMGGGNIAEWKGGKIVFHDLGSKAAQTVQSYVRRSAAPNDLASRSATRPRKSGWSVEDKIAEAKAVRGQVAPDMLPLFDHLLSLARSDAKEGAYPYQRRRAGQYIAKAKGFARKHPRVSGDASKRSPVRKLTARERQSAAKRKHRPMGLGFVRGQPCPFCGSRATKTERYFDPAERAYVLGVTACDSCGAS